MKTLKIKYPWSSLPVDGTFFVPTLRPADTIREGLQASIGTAAIPAKPMVGIHKGKFGVLFRRAK